jgi:hypothetical protein
MPAAGFYADRSLHRAQTHCLDMTEGFPHVLLS